MTNLRRSHPPGIDTGALGDLLVLVMTLLHEAVEAKKYDVRLIERNISRGVIAAEDAAKIQKNLPDDAENAEWISIDSLANEGEQSNGSH